jgi:exopolysaccharide biosynthesis polyprenyl glycosylphosphotransferase
VAPPLTAVERSAVGTRSHLRSGAVKLDRDALLRRSLAAGDAAAVLVALALTVAEAGDSHDALMRAAWGLFAVPLTVLLFKLYGLYDRDVKRISHSTVDDLPWLLHAVVAGTLLLWLYSHLVPMDGISFGWALLFGGATTGIVIVSRFCIRQLSGRWLGPERALLVGGGATARVLVSKLAAHPEYGVEVIGSLTHGGLAASDELELPRLGTLAELDGAASESGATRVVLAGESLGEDELEALLRRCRTLALKVSILPKLYDVLGPGVATDDVEGVAVLGVNPPWIPRSSRAVKRAMDIVVASALLLLFAPVLVLLAVAIKVDSSGPVIFTQERVGRAGRRFRLLKLRTMVADAPAQRERLLEGSIDPHWLHLANDPRITRVGRLVRRLSLDELPQLWNVVRGEMSLVGPRPLIPDEDQRVQDWARGRLELTPGITGYWQVLGRTRIPFEEMVKLDYLYVMNWSLWEDVRLMLRTIPAVFGGRGAN